MLFLFLIENFSAVFYADNKGSNECQTCNDGGDERPAVGG